jgi:ATP phosphoribosyltransferase
MEARPAPIRTTAPMNASATPLRLALPKGRMHDGVVRLLADAGIDVRRESRGYRATLSLPGWEAKMLKPQSIVEMLQAGTRDLGFAGADWVAELDADLVEVFDTRLDPVQVVAAAPAGLLENGRFPGRPLIIATEYPELTRRWIAARNLDARVLHSYGATEVFPPEDADAIVDNTATGATLRANGLVITEELMTSSTRLYAGREAWNDPPRRAAIEELVLLLQAVLEARSRVLVEVNVAAADLDNLVAMIPCMREPTVARLHGDSGYAVKAAVPRSELAVLVPRIRAAGGTDILVIEPSQIVP